MTAMNFRLMNPLKFGSIYNWSVNYANAVEQKYSDKYKLVRIGDFLKRNKKPIEIQDNQLYKRVKIRINGGGISVRDEVFGNEIGTKSQFIVESKQFLLSKIDARNGAFGVVPDECNGAIITGNFWTFDVDYEQINPFYLKILTSSKRFQVLCQNASNGTTNRNYLQEGLFVNMQIPLPNIDIQNQFICQYNQQFLQAQNAENQANELEKGIESYLLEELGIEAPKAVEKKQGLQFIRLKELSRWDWRFLTNDFELNVKYPQTKLGDFISNFLTDEKGKSLRIESFKFPKRYFSYLGMEHIEKNTGTILEMPYLSGDKIKSQTVRVKKGYFIYGKLRPYLNKYWYNETDNDSIICSSEFFVFRIADGVNRLFFQYILSSSVIQKQIEGITSGVRMPRINEDFFKNLQIPLPPKEIQTQIVNHITSQKEQIKTLRQQAEALRKQAKEEFEQEIFI